MRNDILLLNIKFLLRKSYYLSFRTAPVGALAVNGALWETAVVLTSTLGPAFGTGFAIGTYVVAPLIQTYAPTLFNSIGSIVNDLVNLITGSWSNGNAGPVQKETAPIFQTTGLQMDSFSNFGGDYAAAEAWEVYDYSGGGGGCSRDHCYPVTEY